MAESSNNYRPATRISSRLYYFSIPLDYFSIPSGTFHMKSLRHPFRFLPADPKKKDSPFTRNYPFKLNTESIPRVIQPYN